MKNMKAIPLILCALLLGASIGCTHRQPKAQRNKKTEQQQQEQLQSPQKSEEQQQEQLQSRQKSDVKAIYCTPMSNDCLPFDITLKNDSVFVHYQGTDAPENFISLELKGYDTTNRVYVLDEIIEGKKHGKYEIHLGYDSDEYYIEMITYTSTEGKTYKFYAHVIRDTIVSENIGNAVDSIIKWIEENRATHKESGKSWWWHGTGAGTTQYWALSNLLHSNPKTMDYDFHKLTQNTDWKIFKSEDSQLKFYTNAAPGKYKGFYIVETIVQYKNKGKVYTMDGFSDILNEFANTDTSISFDDIMSIADIKIHNINLANKRYYLTDVASRHKDGTPYGRFMLLLSIEKGKLIFNNIIKNAKFIYVPFREYELGEATPFMVDKKYLVFYVPIIRDEHGKNIFNNKYFIYKWNGKEFEYTGKKTIK